MPVVRTDDRFSDLDSFAPVHYLGTSVRVPVDARITVALPRVYAGGEVPFVVSLGNVDLHLERGVLTRLAETIAAALLSDLTPAALDGLLQALGGPSAPSP